MNAQPVAAASTAAAAPGLPSGTQTVSVTDPAYSMTAATMDIPRGWKWKGIIARTGGCHTTGPAIDFTAESPDGVTAVLQLPGVMWTNVISGQLMGRNTCSSVDVTTPTEFLLRVAVPMLHANAAVESVEPLPESGQASLQRQLAAMQQQSQGVGPLGARNITLSGARARVAYSLNGKPVEEMITVVVNCGDHTMPTGVMRVANPPVTRQCTERGTNIVRAPKGQLDAVLNSAAIRGQLASLRVDPAWQQKIAQEQQAKFQGFENHLNSTFQTFMRNNQAQFDQEIANDRAQDAQREASTQSAMAADRQRQAGIDYAAHRQVNLSLNKQDFTDPNTGKTVTLSNQFNHQWMSADGETAVQANDPNFNPDRELPFQGPFTELVPQ